MARPVVDSPFSARLRALRRERGLSLGALARRVQYSRAAVSTWELGTRRPGPEAARRLDAALDAGGTLAALLDTDNGERLNYVTAHPRRLDHETVDILAETLAAQRRLEDRIGSGMLIAPTVAQVTFVETLAREARGEPRRALVDVTGQWLQFAGWLHMTVGRLATADALLDKAILWSAESGNRELTATALSFKGHAAWLVRDLGRLFGLTEAVLAEYPDAYVGQRAYDHHQLARAHALADDHSAALSALAAGVDLVAEAREYRGPTAPWHYYRVDAFWLLEHGLVRALLGDRARADELLIKGFSGLPAELAGAEWLREYRHHVSTPDCGQV